MTARLHGHGVFLLLVLFSLALPLAGQSQSDTSPTKPKIEEIVIYGRQPGPPLWKVTKGDHELWLFGLLIPLPRDMQWDSGKVATVVARAEEYISIKMPEQKIPLNPITLVRALRLAGNLAKNPDGATLEDSLPASMYTRFSDLNVQYPVRNFEDLRPYFAVDALHGNAVRANKLTNDPDVMKRIERLVRRNRNIKQTVIQLGPEYVDFEFMKTAGEKYIQTISSAEELACFEVSLQSIETDLDGMRARANAWALGYVDDLRYYQEYPDVSGACLQVFTNMGDINALVQKANEEWLQAAEQALNTNATTFALLNMDELIKPDGLLAQLRARGYQIDEP